MTTRRMARPKLTIGLDLGRPARPPACGWKRVGERGPVAATAALDKQTFSWKLQALEPAPAQSYASLAAL